MVKRKQSRRSELQNKYEFLKAGPLQQELMAFGFECDDRWYTTLCDKCAGEKAGRQRYE